jgi:Holliday junction resolvase
MSDTSERQLQECLNANGYYTERAPASGVGIQKEDGERAIHPDVTAIKAREDATVYGSLVRFYEDKHVEAPRAYLDADEIEGLRYLSEKCKAKVAVAVKWKYKQKPHEVYALNELDETDGGRYVAVEGEGKPITDVNL